jgi:hypothetical protein
VLPVLTVSGAPQGSAVLTEGQAQFREPRYARAERAGRKWQPRNTDQRIGRVAGGSAIGRGWWLPRVEYLMQRESGMSMNEIFKVAVLVQSLRWDVGDG